MSIRCTCCSANVDYRTYEQHLLECTDKAEGEKCYGCNQWIRATQMKHHREVACQKKHLIQQRERYESLFRMNHHIAKQKIYKRYYKYMEADAERFKDYKRQYEQDLQAYCKQIQEKA